MRRNSSLKCSISPSLYLSLSSKRRQGGRQGGGERHAHGVALLRERNFPPVVLRRQDVRRDRALECEIVSDEVVGGEQVFRVRVAGRPNFWLAIIDAIANA